MIRTDITPVLVSADAENRRAILIGISGSFGRVCG